MIHCIQHPTEPSLFLMEVFGPEGNKVNAMAFSRRFMNKGNEHVQTAICRFLIQNVQHSQLVREFQDRLDLEKLSESLPELFKVHVMDNLKDTAEPIDVEELVNRALSDIIVEAVNW